MAFYSWPDKALDKQWIWYTYIGNQQLHKIVYTYIIGLV